ncbi:MAG: iron(III) transport system permease protein [Glaciecola sp.]|jgi:iron(III) transport system permease protein
MPTHRPTLALAMTALVLFGLLPLAVMAWRITGDMSALSRLLDERTISLIGRTVLLGSGVAALALLVGIPFGYLVARTDLPGRTLWAPLAWVPLLLPPLVMAMSWTVLAPMRGASMTIWILGLGHFPLVATFVAKAARRIDRRQVEAARLVGGWSAQWRMEWPLIAPAAVLGATLAFVFAINDFAVPDYVSSVGAKFNVYADEVFATWQVDQKDAEAVSTALPLIALTLAALSLALFMRRRGSLASLAGGFERPPVLRLGRAKLPALLFAVGLITASVFMPVGQLLNEAGTGESGWSLGHTAGAFSMALERCRDNLRASILFAAAAATAALPVAFALAHAAARMRHGKWILAACMLPFAAPAILFGIGQITVWNHPETQDFYTGDGLVIGMLLGRYLAFPALVLTSAIENLSPRLEEAAAMVGTSPFTRLFRIVAPPLLPALAGAWTLVFVFSMRELDAAILVPGANKSVMFRLYNAVHFYRQDYVAALALVTLFVIMIPGLLWSLFARKKMDVLS